MWKVGKENEPTIQCSLVKSPTIYLEPIPRSKIQFLMKEYPNQEWLAYMTGRISEKANLFVENISVPPHKEASGGSAEAEPFHIPENCVGVIHSHHSMGAFHSATDQAYVDKNYPVSITVARNGDSLSFDAVSYQETPCGKGITLKSSVEYAQPPEPLFDKDSFLKGAKENIDKGKRFIPVVYQYAKPPYGGYQPPFGEQFSMGSEGRLSQQDLQDIYKDVWKD